jgi:hypothetical protein
MHMEAHAAVAWLLSTLSPQSDRRLRNCCVAAAVLPDIDAINYLWGHESYARWHHTYGHNIFYGLLIVLFCVWLHRHRSWSRRGLVALLVALSFASHLVTDAYFTRYPVYYLWPLNRWEFLFDGGFRLSASINRYLVYGGAVMAIVVAVFKQVTPLDIFWPRLDRIVLNAFRRRDDSCSYCKEPCNNCCSHCEASVCLRDGRVNGRFYISCPACQQSRKESCG